MNKKELNSIKDVIDSVDKSWPKDVIVRYLYIKLAPFVQHDLKYFLASDEEKYREYKEGFIDRFPDIVCSTLADFYVKVFNEFDIRSTKVIANSARIPLFAVIVEGDNGWFFIDPINDLYRNQYGLKPQNFGVIPFYKTINREHSELIKLDPLYVKEIDKEIGKNFDMIFLDPLFELLHKEFANRNKAYDFFEVSKTEPMKLLEKKIEYISRELINLGQVNGVYERSQMYLYFRNYLLDRNEKEHTVAIIEKGDKNHHITFMVLPNDEEPIRYIEEKDSKGYKLKKEKSLHK